MASDLARVAEGSSGRRLTENTLYLLLGYGVGRTAAFLLVVVLARHLNIDDLAIVILAQSIAIYLSMILDFGITIAAIRLVALNQLGLSAIVSTVVSIRIGLAAAFAVVGAIVSVVLGATLDSRVFLGVLAFVLAAVIAASDVSWVAQGIGRTLPRGVVLSVTALTQLAATGLLLGMGLSIVSAEVGVLLGAAAGVGIGLVLTIPLIKSLPKPTLAVARAVGRAAIPLGVASLLTQIYYSFDIFLLSATRPPEDVAIYGALYKLPSVFTTISWSICVASLPGFTIAFAHGVESLRRSVERNVRVLLALATPMLVLLAVEAPAALSTLFGPTFVAGAPALRILLVSVELAFVSGTVLYGLTAAGRLRVFSFAAATGAVLNVSFDVVTVPTLGMEAAAWGTVLAELGVLGVASVVGRDVTSRAIQTLALRFAFAGMIAAIVGINVEPRSSIGAAVLSLCLYGGLTAIFRVWDPIDGVVVNRGRQVVRRFARIHGK
jgi:O-antigen/teichoic acid export membrane protein